MSDNKKNIAILTLVSYNYGNRLQNYALQETLEKMGLNVETLLRVKPTIISIIKREVRGFLKNDIFSKFNRFNKIIHWSKDVVSPQITTVTNNSKYDYYIIGSDQIWNPKIDNCTECVYLPQISKEKKIAFAASFGTTDFLEKEIIKILPLIKNIGRISVREKEGADFINNNLFEQAKLIIDPTLMLTKEEWQSVEKKPNFIKNKKYVLVYMLGNEKYEETVRKVANYLNSEIIVLNTNNCAVEPFEFIYLIHHSEVVLTDSFHGSVFSFIFGKKFFILDRIDEKEDMSCRLKSFCEMFNISKYNKFELESKIDLRTNYSEGYKILDLKRKEAREFLENALKINQNKAM